MTDKQQHKHGKKDYLEEINLGISNKLLAFIACLLLIISTANSIILINEKGKDVQLREPKKITGQSTSQGTASLTILESGCNLHMLNKWNMVGLCANVTNTSIKSVLNPINGSYDYLLEWNETSQQFMVYSSKSSANTFNDFQKNKSYFIYINQPAENLHIPGNEYGDINLSLAEKWNVPFYPYIFDGNISIYLATLSNNYDYMMKWSNVDQAFYIFARMSTSHPFDYIYGGEGQMIHITNASGAQLRYNKTKIKNG